MRREDGQIIPALVMVMLALIVVGLLFFQVGRAAVFSTEAQSGADAAALAAAEDVRKQLLEQLATTGTTNLALINPVRVRAAAELYAQRNKGHVTRLERNGVDIRVWVRTNSSLDREGTRAEARARARLDLLPLGGGFGLGSNMGPTPTGGNPRISQKEWDKLAEEISNPPGCGNGGSSNDLVKLGRLLREHGFAVGENAELGDNPAPGVHSENGYHYRCRNSAAIDVNYDANEKPVIDAIVGPLQKLGFRTIWQTTDHYDHIHIDLANSGSIGPGFGLGGAVGALEHSMLEVKLIDWEAALLPFGGLGGLGGGGYYAGPPDPEIARIICRTLDRYNASPKVALSAFEAAIVESGVKNLPYGDRDSLGVFQQRPSVGFWGTAAQIRDPVHAAWKYVTTAIARDRPGYSAGQLAQAVQGSAFPLRYDQVQLQAYSLLEKFC